MPMTRRTAMRHAVAGAALALPMMGRSARAADHEWILPHALPKAAPLHARLMEAAAKIEQDSAGKMVVTVLPEGQRGNSVGLLSQIRAGTIPIAAIATQALGGATAAAAVPSVGFAWRAPSRLWTALDGPLGEMIRQQVALSLSVTMMDRAFDAGFRDLITRERPIRNPDDMAALRLRVPVDSDTIAMFLKLGAAPSSVPAADVNRALTSRRIDAIDGTLPMFRSGRIDETEKLCSLTAHIWDGYWICAHGKTWDALPADLRGIVSHALGDAAVAQRKDMDDMERAAHEALDADGVKFTAVDNKSFRDTLRQTGYYADWTKRVPGAIWAGLEKAAGTLA